MEKKEFIDIDNSSSGLSIRYSGTLGTAWFKHALDNRASDKAIADEKEKREAYKETIRLNKCRIINQNKLEIKSFRENKLTLQRETDTKILSYSFYIYPRDFAHLLKHTGIDLLYYINIERKDS